MTLPIETSDRVVLDTSVVRALIEGEANALNVKKLGEVKQSHLVSLAHGAVGELLYWLWRADDAVLRRVKPALMRLDAVLDPEFPVAPGGSERMAMAGLIDWPNRSREDESLWQKNVWRHLRRISGRHSVFKKELRFRDTRGRLNLVSPLSPDSNLKLSQDEWTDDVVELPAGKELTKAQEAKLVRTRINHVAAVLDIDRGAPALERLELFHQLIARRMRESSLPNAKLPRRPSSNAALDADLLIYLVLPAVVCTSDVKFVRTVRQLSSEDRFRVMTPHELVLWLDRGELPPADA